MVVVLPATTTTRTTTIFFLHAACFFLILLSFNIAAAASRPPSFSFNFSDTSSYNKNDLWFEGDAALNLNDDLVDLTCRSKDKNCNNSGRMSYNHSVPFYMNNTGVLTSFSTNFTFAIKPTNSAERDGGMAFFLSFYPSRLPRNSSGNLLGLTNNYTSASGIDQFIAVEFNTYVSQSDPEISPNHIGIDLNSLDSLNTTTLPSYGLNGTMTAFITFNGSSRMLAASLHFDSKHSLDAAHQVEYKLPDDVALPSEVAVGFSASTGKNIELHQILSWSFSSTMAFKDDDSSVKALIIGGGGVASLALLIAGWWIISWCRWRRTRDLFGKESRLKRFNYHDLASATDNFSKEKKIGAGGFGVVYSGILKTEQPVAVKEILKDSRGENTDFLAELRAIGQTSHRNIVRLEGWCCSRDNWDLLGFMCWCLQKQNFKLFLVYELVPNGNLHEHLYERPDVLPWTSRYKIVKGIGSALHYLHHQCKPYILHRDIKPSNVLVDDDFNAKLGDFGLSRFAEANGTSVLPTTAVGTLAYMDPLCMENGQVKFRQSSDIYSFGLVLLEIVHGKNNRNLVRKLHKNQPDIFAEVAADKKLAGQFDKTQMGRVITLGLLCSEQDEKKRPSLIGAMQFLEYGEELCPATPDIRHTAANIMTSSDEHALILSPGA